MEEHPSQNETSKDQDFANLHIWQIQSIRDLLFISSVVLIFWIGYAMRSITIPLLLALGLAYLFEPFIDWLGNRFRVRRPWAVSGIILVFIVTMILVIVPAGMLAVSQTAELISGIRSGRYAGLVDKGVTLLPDNYQDQADEALVWVEQKLPWTKPIIGDREKDLQAKEPLATEGTKDPAVSNAVVMNPSETEEQRIRRIVQDEYARIQDVNSGGGTNVRDVGMRAIGFVKTGASQVSSFIFSTVELALLIFLVPFYFFFFSMSYPGVSKFGRNLIPLHNRKRILYLISEMDRAVSGFVRGRLVISAILATVLAIGWLIVGVPYSIALGLVVGVFCAVPYLSVIGLPISIALLAVDQYSLAADLRMEWWGIIVWPGLVYFIAQQLDDWVLTPLIQGKSTNLDPVSIVVAILAGGSLAGIYGMLLAVPAAACIKILLTEVLMPRIREWTRGDAKDPIPGG